jgi:hypothetical protein
VAVVAAFLPWAASGRRDRSSFALFRVADHLGVLPEGAEATAARAWPLLPLLAAVALALAALRRVRLAGALTTALGAASVVAAVAVLRCPLPPLVGAWLGLVAGALAIVGGLAAVALGGRRDRERDRGPVVPPASPPAPAAAAPLPRAR